MSCIVAPTDAGCAGERSAQRRLSRDPSQCALGRQRVDVHRGFLSRHSKIVLANDVVAVEHSARDVSGHRHRDAFRDTGTYHVPGPATRDGRRDPRRHARVPPRR